MIYANVFDHLVQCGSADLLFIKCNIFQRGHISAATHYEHTHILFHYPSEEAISDVQKVFNLFKI